MSPKATGKYKRLDSKNTQQEASIQNLTAGRTAPRQSGEISDDDYDWPDFTSDDWEALDGLAKSVEAKRNAELKRANDILGRLTKHQATFYSREISDKLAESVPEIRERLSELVTAHAVGLKEKPEGPVSRYTTRSVLSEERSILDHAETLAETRGYFVPAQKLAEILDRQDRFPALNEEQRQAVMYLTAGEGFAMLTGEAGTGKTTVLNAVREAYEAQGSTVLALSWTNDVVQQLKQNGFKNASTVSSALNSLKSGKSEWNDETIVVVDEAAMLSSDHVRELLHEAQKAEAKIVLAGDDHQLSSIERGGMFSELRRFQGSAELHDVVRIADPEQQRAFNYMHKREFREALEIFSTKGAVHWAATQGEAIQNLLQTWGADCRGAPEKSRLVFAYRNEEVNKFNRELRQVYRSLGHLKEDRFITTKQGKTPFAVGDRLQFTGTDKQLGFYSGRFGTIQEIDEQNRITVKEDGGRDIVVNPKVFTDFRHGYASTIHRGQGKTLDQTYLFHSRQWRAAESYVALTRHRDKTALFVARDTVNTIDDLARFMRRTEDRPPAIQFHTELDEKLIRGMDRLNIEPTAGDKRKRLADNSSEEPRKRRRRMKEFSAEVATGKKHNRLNDSLSEDIGKDIKLDLPVTGRTLANAKVLGPNADQKSSKLAEAGRGSLHTAGMRGLDTRPPRRSRSRG